MAANVDPTGHDEAVRKRLLELATRDSQSNLARKTGVPAHYISRYLAGTRIPASFCAALAHNADINPVWLLTGQGSPKLSDAALGVSATAGDLLGTVQAMEAVSRVRLGALSGTGHHKILRALGDTLESYESLRAQFNRRARPMLEKLLDDAAAALSDDLALTRRSLDAAHSLARLCDDAALGLRLKTIEGGYWYGMRDYQKAYEIHREVLLTQTAIAGGLDHQYLVRVRAIVMELITMCRMDEALRFGRAILQLAFDLRKTEAYAKLRFVVYLIAMELGCKGMTIERVARAGMRCGELLQGRHSPEYHRLCLLRGTLSIGESLVICRDALARMPVSARRGVFNNGAGNVIWFEEPAALRAALDIFDTPKAGPDPLYLEQLKLLAAAGEHSRRGELWAVYAESNAFRDALALGERDKWHWLARIFRAQAARLLGREDDLVNEVLAMEAVLRALPEGMHPRQIWAGLHSRNVMTCAARLRDSDEGRAAVRQARRHILRYARRGFAAYLADAHRNPSL